VRYMYIGLNRFYSIALIVEELCSSVCILKNNLARFRLAGPGRLVHTAHDIGRLNDTGRYRPMSYDNVVRSVNTA